VRGIVFAEACWPAAIKIVLYVGLTPMLAFGYVGLTAKDYMLPTATKIFFRVVCRKLSLVIIIMYPRDIKTSHQWLALARWMG
jgi:hypothetical protein